MKRLFERGLAGALFRYQLMANIVGVLIIPLFIFAGLRWAYGGYQVAVAVLGVTHGYLYIVYLITAGHLALKARLHIENGRFSPSGLGWILLMFVAGLVPGLTFVVEWLVVTRKIQPLMAAQAASEEAAGVSPAAR
jgi:integral membrane protein